VEFRNDTLMKNELSNAGVRSPNMSGLTEPEDPDSRLQAAWLAQVSDDGLLAKEAGGSTSELTSSSVPTDRLSAQEVRVAPAHVDRRPGLTTKVLIGSILAAALAAIVGIPSYLSFFETSQQPTGDPMASPDRVKSATPPMQNESETPKLVVEPTLGAPGEPAPIGLALRGRTNDAVVILRGLAPGMELSAGSAVSGDSWQLSATDLPYAWIAPPKDFIGSADLVAELRLPNAQIADRQTLHVKWARAAAAGSGDEQKHEQLIGRKEINPVSPTAPATVQHPRDNDREAITPAPPISAHPSPRHLDREEGQRARTPGRSNVRRSSANTSRGALFASPQVRDGTQTVKGFWDWSR
jgi:hypothetical protein